MYVYLGRRGAYPGADFGWLQGVFDYDVAAGYLYYLVTVNS